MKIVIAAGGTGGHLYPAIAYAKAFQSRDPQGQVLFIGSGKSLEGEILKKEGFAFERIRVEGFVGRNPLDMIRALCLLPYSLWQSIGLLRKQGTHLVIGTGGYFSPPVILAAWILRIPRVLLEPNAMPGFANRVLAPFANVIFLAFESARQFFSSNHTQVIGTPVRKDFILDAPIPMPSKVSHVLVFGGSQGARAINSAMLEAVAISSLIRKQLTITHQTGPQDLERVRAEYVQLGVDADVQPFLFDMPKQLLRADIVVCRSGASTLAELAAYGKVGILVPFPQATHHHQDKNAQAVVQEGAARMIPQAQLTGARLAGEIEGLMRHPEHLQAMGERSWALRKVHATEQMVEACLSLVNHHAA
ncbi:MAG: undecaprenyldiphospho-muramoylpentapeptide beta-N-acetylglucosaminyltransferase [Nitrospirales bacterium]|nr:undecaprenyldiphospho-muramoylpentapeptide beta-N-acetylglucosaminyltransferase [Nitrospirales bacterium]